MNSTPPLLTYPLPLALAQLHQDYRPGDLTGSRCTVTQYAELPAYPDDRYDLVCSRLKPKPLDETGHDEVVNALFRHLQRAGVENRHHILRNALVYVPPPPQSSRHSNPPSDPCPNVTVRRADICIVPPGEHPGNAIFGYGGREKPTMVIEVTARNPSKRYSRQVDLKDKWDEYFRAGIPEYVVVVRDTVDPAVFVGTLDGACQARRRYREHSFSPADVVQCSYFGEAGLTAAHLLRFRGRREGNYGTNGVRTGPALGGDTSVRGKAQVHVMPIVTGKFAGLRSRLLGHVDAWLWFGNLDAFHEKKEEYNDAKYRFNQQKRRHVWTRILEMAGPSANQ